MLDNAAMAAQPSNGSTQANKHQSAWQGRRAVDELDVNGNNYVSHLKGNKKNASYNLHDTWPDTENNFKRKLKLLSVLYENVNTLT